MSQNLSADQELVSDVVACQLVIKQILDVDIQDLSQCVKRGQFAFINQSSPSPVYRLPRDAGKLRKTPIRQFFLFHQFGKIAFHHPCIPLRERLTVFFECSWQ